MCGACGLRHGGSVQMRLAHYPSWAILWTEWGKWRNDSATYAKNWLLTALDHDTWLCARLLIPNSLLDTMARHERHWLRSVAGLFQLPAVCTRTATAVSCPDTRRAAIPHVDHTL